ncbi:MAG: hypothetical protein Q9197_006105 [Variospora fuerteventurae]
MTAQNLTSFVLGLDRTNVTEGTNAAQGLTCLCPIDAALAALANTTGNTTDGPASLLATLTRHGLTGSYYSTNFSDGDLIYSQNGYPILVSRSDDGTVFLNDARLVGSNYIARTGAVHAVDREISTLIDFNQLLDHGLPQHHHQHHHARQRIHLQRHREYTESNALTVRDHFVDDSQRRRYTYGKRNGKSAASAGADDDDNG